MGPQKISVSGDQGSDTYTAGANAADWLLDDNDAPKTDTLVLEANLENIHAYRSEILDNSVPDLNRTTFSDDLIIVYKDLTGKKHHVRVKAFFKGKAYQHLQIKTKDGHILQINNHTKSSSLTNDIAEKNIIKRFSSTRKEFINNNGKVELTPIAFDLSSQNSDTSRGANFNGSLLEFEEVQQVTGTIKSDQLMGNSLSNIINGHGTDHDTDQLTGGEGSDFYMLQAYLNRPNKIEINNFSTDKVVDYLVLDANYHQLSNLMINNKDLYFKSTADNTIKQKRMNELMSAKGLYNTSVDYLKMQIAKNAAMSQAEFLSNLNEKSMIFKGNAIVVQESDIAGSAAQKILGKSMSERLKKFALNVPPAQNFAQAMKQKMSKYQVIVNKYQQELNKVITYNRNASFGSIDVTLKNWVQGVNYQHLNVVTKDNLTLQIKKNGSSYQFDVTSYDASMSAYNTIIDLNKVTNRHPYSHIIKFTGSRYGDRINGNNLNNLIQGGGNGGNIYSYDTLIGGNGYDVYTYTPGKDGLVVLNTNSTDNLMDLALFNANYHDIKITTVNVSDQQKSIHLGKSIGLYVEGKRSGLVIQHFQTDEAHRNLVFKSRDGKLFKIDHESLDKKEVSESDDMKISQLIQSISGFNTGSSVSESVTPTVTETNSLRLVQPAN